MMVIFCNQGAYVVRPFELLRVEWVIMEKIVLLALLHQSRAESSVADPIS